MRNKISVKLIIVILIFLFTFEGCSTTPEINNTVPYLLELDYMWGGEGRNFYFDVNPIKNIKKQPEIRKIFTGEPLKWFFHYGAGRDITYTPFFASPPVFYKDVLYFEDTGGFYYAIDAKTGKIKWKQDIQVDPNQLNPSFASPPLIIDNIIFFAGGPLYGLDINSGKIVYKQDIGTINAPGFKDGIIYLSSASIRKRTAKVVGIDVTKGKIVAKRILDKLASIEAPLFYKDSVIVYDKYSGNIHSLDLKTLNLKWEIKQQYGCCYSACISNNKLILVRWVTDSTIYPLTKMQCVAIDPENGKILWEVSFEDEEREEDKDLIMDEYDYIFYSFVVSDSENIYFGNNEGFIYAVDSNGKLLWKIKTEPLGSISDFTRNVPVIAKDTLYVVTTEGPHSGYLYAIDTKTSKILFKYHLPVRAEYAVTVADDRVYVTSGLQIFELKN